MRHLNAFARRVIPTPALRRLRLLRRRWKGHPPVATGLEQLDVADLDSFAVAYRANTADEEVIRQGFANDVFLTAVPEYQPGAGDVVIDVGAHIGAFSLLIASRIGGGKVFSVEACRETFNLLRLNARLNRLDNMHPEHLALSDRNGQVELYHDRENWGHSTVARLSSKRETVNSETLERFMGRNGIDVCDLLRMNCEGAEFPIILHSSAEVLRRVRTMLVLYHCDLYPGATEASLESHLKNCGFSTRYAERRSSRGWLVATRQS